MKYSVDRTKNVAQRVASCKECSGEPPKEISSLSGMTYTKCAICWEVIECWKGIRQDMMPPKNTKFEFIENKAWLGDTFKLTEKIPDESVDCVCEDPPYGMEFQSNHRKLKHSKIKNDNNLDWLPDHLKECYRILKEDRHAYFFCSDHFLEIFKTEIQKVFKNSKVLIWEKDRMGMGNLKDYGSQNEYIIFAKKGKRDILGKRRGTIFKYPMQKNIQHPTEKPVDLIRELIQRSTNENELVFDGFGGRGTTAIAAKIDKRNYITIELDKSNFEIINFNLDNIHSFTDVKNITKNCSIKIGERTSEKIKKAKQLSLF